MKPIKLLFLLLLSSVGLYGQEYVPLIDTSRTWNVAEIQPHGGGATSFEYFFGDTVSIDDTMYVEVKSKLPDKSGVHGYIREDTESRRVYYKRSIYASESDLLYDFSLEEGDTVQLYGDPGQKYTVLQIDTVELLNGDVRKRWKLSHAKYFTYVVWIEGIGNITIYLLNPGDLDGSTIETITLCCYENAELVYMNDTYNTCYLDWVNVSETDSETLKVYPNPTNGLITLSFQQFHAYNDILFEVLSIEGRKLLSKPIHNELSTHDISNLPAGSYLYRFTDGRHQIKTGKIIIH